MRFVLAFALLFSLAGCGSDEPGRVQGGSATGAMTGGAIGIIGGPVGVVVGAVIGGGAGALTAANTTPHAVDLGNPPWSP
jgi:phage tail tape-measure protein